MRKLVPVILIVVFVIFGMAGVASAISEPPERYDIKPHDDSCFTDPKCDDIIVERDEGDYYNDTTPVSPPSTSVPDPVDIHYVEVGSAWDAYSVDSLLEYERQNSQNIQTIAFGVGLLTVAAIFSTVTLWVNLPAIRQGASTKGNDKSSAAPSA